MGYVGGIQVPILAVALAAPIALSAQAPAGNDPLARRAELGAAIRPPDQSAPARVVRVDGQSPLGRAGLRAGDEVLGLNGRALADPIDFDRQMAALRAGDRVRLDLARSGAPAAVEATLDAMPRDVIPGVEIEYGVVANPAGFRQRVIVTRPQAAASRRPAVLFVPWLSCDSIEVPARARGGIEQLLYGIAERSNWVLMRVDKPGVGDSEGVCADTDFATEFAGYRAALARLVDHPWVDASKIVIMGQSFSGAFLPQVADGTPVAGYIFINSWSRTWVERLIEFERLQLEQSDTPPDVTTDRVRALATLYARMFDEEKTPSELFVGRPDLAAVWSDQPEHQYGRPARFFHQLARLNPAAYWMRVGQPTLVIWGEADIVMGRLDHERIAAFVNRNRPGAARLLTVPGMDHGLLADRPGQGRVLPREVPDAVLEFLRAIG